MRQGARAGNGEAGFTLVEVLISLALFALLAIAGLALVETVLRVEQGTAGRLERVAAVQRAFLVLTRDLEGMNAATLRHGGERLSFQPLPRLSRPVPPNIAYRTGEGRFVREVGGREQLLLSGVESGAWRFWIPGAGWQAALPVPPPPVPGVPVPPPPAPRAAEISLVLTGGGGVARRVVILPSPPPQRASPQAVPIDGAIRT